jgi:hypothetical protein
MADPVSPENAGEALRLLAADHAELDGLLRALRAELEGGDAAAALARLDLFWARLAMHIRAENLHLFPAILAALSGDEARRDQTTPSREEARADIARLRGDHDFFMHELAGAVKAMRGLKHGGVREGNVLGDVNRVVRTLDGRLAAHNRLEEERVYRLPAVLLTAAEQAELAARVRRELDNLPPRFVGALRR